MGGGLAGWLTPGWMSYDKSMAPHIDTPSFVKERIAAGEDPKPEVLEKCKPECKYWKDKLTRCETQLEKIIKKDWTNPLTGQTLKEKDIIPIVRGATGFSSSGHQLMAEKERPMNAIS